MQLTEQLNTPGEHAGMLDGLVGPLESVLLVPEQMNSLNLVAILGHPHSLQGGTMNNKVVSTMARAFKDLNIPSLRCNFRGVGKSAGIYDDGIGESADLLHIMEQWRAQWPQIKFIVAGFSFGSYVAYRVAALTQTELLITIAPPVHHYAYTEFSSQPHPWVIIQGDEDEIVPYELIEEFVPSLVPSPTVVEFKKTGHFFHGKLLELRSCLVDMVQAKVLKT